MERRVLSQALALLPLVHGIQQAMPFKRWRSLLERSVSQPVGGIGHASVQPRTSSAPPGVKPPAPSVDHITWAVEVARRWLPGEYKCLPAAYATHLLLHFHGYPSEVHVGVGRDQAGKVEAHAWVVCQGRTVIGLVEDMERFVPFPPVSPQPRAERS